MSSSDILLERLRVATADEYEIERQIGRGGMAAVFLARDLALNRHVAIKVMRPDLVDVEGLQDRFVIEARTAAQLDHPGIVTVHAVRQRAGLLFIVMKYIEGHTLEGVLKNERTIEPSRAFAIGGRVAEALHFAHTEGVVHRDVKPSNIMIDLRGRPVVTDFGIARVMAGESITVAGSMLGTPTYMSPEQCRGQAATFASDQYALGVTLYEMIAGKPPFGGSMFELLDAHRNATPEPLSRFVPVDSELEQLVNRMLAKDPSQRWGSLGEVAERLGTDTRTTFSGFGEASSHTPSAAAATIPVPEPAEPAAETPATVDPTQHKLRRVLIGTAGMLAVVLSALVIKWNQSGSTPPPPATPVVTQAPVPVPVRADSDTVASQPVDSTTVAAAPKDSSPPPVIDSAPPPVKKPAAKPTATAPKPRADSVRPLRIAPESLAIECSRLLERVSLGERLTPAETALLRRSCQKKGS
jgi:eukaryotic-like serine/threonine-protein kinase